MKTTLLLTVALLSLSLWCSTPVAPAQDENRFGEIQELAQRNPAGALEEAKEFRAELRIQHERNPGHMVIGKAASLAGMIASEAGEHKEAVSLLKEGTGIIAKARDGAPLLDEFVYRGTLYDSLLELGRTADALAMTEKMLKRVREEVARFPRALTLKVDTGPGQESDLNDLLASEEWIVKLQENIGTLQLEAENWAEAEKALREAEKILGEIHPEQEALVAKLREGWETAARAQGKPIRPKVVGRFGHPRAIRIEGAAEVTADEISSALVRSGSFVMASHPSADFEKFLEKTKRCLELGYRSAGFPEVTAVVEWDEGSDTVVARMVEGPRFRKGAIRVHGAVVVTEKELLERLIKKEGEAPNTLSRAEASYRGILERKRLGGARMKDPFEEILSEGGPEKKEGEEGSSVDFSQLQTSSDTSAKGVWEEGNWVNFQPFFLNSVEAVLRAAYAAKGHFFPEFEVKLEEGREDGEMDLAVRVVEEGSPALLGKVRVGGARINSEQEVLEYLNLETGMELTGDYLGRIKRKLYESGRFLGWEVAARRPDADEREVDLLIEVAEEWEAPPLSEPLTRGQEAMLRFANWLNTEAGETSDLLFSLTDETEFGSMGLSFAIGRAGWAFKADGLGHRVRAVAEWDGNAELVIGGEEGPGFRAAFPMGELALTAYAWILHGVPLDPYSFKTGSMNFGAGFSSNSERKLEFGMDPAAALKWCPSAFAFRVLDGEVVIEDEYSVLRFEEESGRLISLQAGSRGMQLTAKAEVGAVARIEAEVKEMGQGVPNWLDGRSPSSLFFLAIGYGVELMQDEADRDAEVAPKEHLARAAKRTGKWEPVATFLGEVLGALVGIGKEKKPEDRFTIPLDPEDMEARLKAGGNMNMVLGLGLYETIAGMVEPGSWPDRVAREAMFIMDGKPSPVVRSRVTSSTMRRSGYLNFARAQRF